MKQYTVRASVQPPAFDELEWDAPGWAAAEPLEINHFRPESSEHQPRTRARLLYEARGIHGLFQVHDRYVRCLRTRYHDEVWKDSCVEFFAQPRPERGYLNFEFNCGGAFLASYIVNPERAPGGFKEFTKVPAALGQTIQVRTSLPGRTEPERAESVVWMLRFFIPFALLEHYVGPLGKMSGQVWRANFYKCADESSHPHWASWSPVDRLDFHNPPCFGQVTFE